MTAPIISEDVFNKMDKNKDGFVSKGKTYNRPPREPCLTKIPNKLIMEP